MLIVSNYHYIREDFSAKYPSIFGVTPDHFRRQLEELALQGKFISLEELLNWRDKPINGNRILITFDDGLKEQYELAKPILNAMGIPAIFFVNTSNFAEKEVSLVHKIHLVRSEIAPRDILRELKKRDNILLSEKEKDLAIAHYNYDDSESATLKYLLNFKMTIIEQQEFISPLFKKLFNEDKVNSDLYFGDEMLQELHSQGQLGSHSHHHIPLGQVSTDQLSHELNETQDFFRSSFGSPAKSISYPYGSFEACTGVSAAVEEAGFKIGFTMERAANESIATAPLLLSRFDCNDLPLGKKDLFKETPIFKNPILRKWHKNERSFTDK